MPNKLNSKLKNYLKRFLAAGRIYKFFWMHPKGMQKKLHKNSVIHVRTNPEATSEVELDLIFNKPRDVKSTEIVKQKIQELNSTYNLLFFDLGAHIGWYTLLASEHLPPEKIFAVEADPTNFALLNEQLRLNGIEGSNTFNCAIIPHPDTLTFGIHKKRSNKNRINPPLERRNEFNFITIDGDSFDNLSSEYYKVSGACYFVRMDIEGAEENFPGSASQLLQSAAPCVIFAELHPWINKRIFARNLEENGFKLTWARKDKGATQSVKDDFDALLDAPGSLHVRFERFS